MRRSKKASTATPRDAERAQALARMMAGFVHQFRTPLHVIASSVEGMKQASDFPKSLESDRSLIERSVERLQTAVKNLLTFAKGDEIPWTERSINEPLNHAADFLKDECAKRKLKFEIKLDANLPRTRMQTEWLEEALMNFAVNGMEAMSAGGTLTISTERQKDKGVLVKIKDTGAGMTPAVIKHLGKAYSTGKKSGVGLGVYFATEILKKHKARLQYTSELGLGTTVHITF